MEVGLVRSGEPVELLIAGARGSEPGVLQITFANSSLQCDAAIAVQARVALIPSGTPPPSSFPRTYAGTATVTRGLAQAWTSNDVSCPAMFPVEVTLAADGSAVLDGEVAVEARTGETAPMCVTVDRGLRLLGSHAAGRVMFDVFLQSTEETATGSYDDGGLQLEYMLTWSGMIAGFPPRELSQTESLSMDLTLMP